MGTIGLLGGTNWSETARYYRLAKETLGLRAERPRDKRLLLDWVDDHELEYLQVTSEWDAAAQMLIACAEAMQASGAQAILLCGSLHPEVNWRVVRAMKIPVVALHEAATPLDMESAVQQALSLVPAPVAVTSSPR